MSYFPLILIFPSIYAVEFAVSYIFFLLFQLLANNQKLFSINIQINLISISLFYLFACAGYFFFQGFIEKSLRLVPLILVYSIFIIRTNISHNSLHSLRAVLVFLIWYIAVTTIWLALGDQESIIFRHTFYPLHEGAELGENVWGNPLFESYSSFRNPRFAGLFYNPNILGGLIFFILLGFYELYNPKIFSKYFWIVVTPSIFLLVLAGSRVYILASMVFFLSRLLTRDRVNFFLPALALMFLLLPFLMPAIISGFGEGGSMVIKFGKITNYLQDATLMELFFGSNYHIAFDSEFGFFIGNYGLIIFTILCYAFYYLAIKANISKAFVFSIFITGAANTIFYNLFYFCLIFVILIFLLNQNRNPL